MYLSILIVAAQQEDLDELHEALEHQQAEISHLNSLLNRLTGQNAAGTISFSNSLHTISVVNNFSNALHLIPLSSEHLLKNHYMETL